VTPSPVHDNWRRHWERVVRGTLARIKEKDNDNNTKNRNDLLQRQDGIQGIVTKENGS